MSYTGHCWCGCGGLGSCLLDPPPPPRTYKTYGGPVYDTYRGKKLDKVWYDELGWIKNKEPQDQVSPTKTAETRVVDGGPSDYYDFQPDWSTFNDFSEYKSIHQWKEHSFHLGNIGKVLCRWGDKLGTGIEYDCRKIIYSGVRTLKMIIGTEKTREYLQRLLDDNQFK